MCTAIAGQIKGVPCPRVATEQKSFAVLRREALSTLLMSIGMKPIDHYACPPPSVPVPLVSSLAIDDAAKRRHMVLAFTGECSHSTAVLSAADRVSLSFVLRGGVVCSGALAHLRGIPVIERIVAAVAAEESVEGYETLKELLVR